VELGTGTAWTAIALAAADLARRVVSYDPVARQERERYLALVPPSVRARIELRAEPAEAARPARASVGFLFVDCAHDRETTANAFRAWRDAVAPGGVAVFHDYGHPDYPGVREAVAELGLEGREKGGLFVWRQPASAVNGKPPRIQ
jgi:SAM-dependent methyltransferase